MAEYQKIEYRIDKSGKLTETVINASEPLTLQVATERQCEIRLDIGEIAEVSQSEVIFDDKGSQPKAEQ